MDGWPRVIQNNKIVAFDLNADSRNVLRFLKSLNAESSLAYQLYTRPLELYNELVASDSSVNNNSALIKAQFQYITESLK